MSMVSVVLLVMHLLLPGCTSLKEKRGRLKPLLARLQREFNVSAAEVERQDAWQESILAVAAVSNDAVHNRQLLQKVLDYTQNGFPDLEVIDSFFEIR